LLIFDHLKREGKVSEKLPVYLDSPMGLKATWIYEKYPQLFNSELQQQRSWDDPFDFPGLVLVEKGVQSKKVDQLRGAKVIIAGSGMMTGGRIVFHARRWLSDAKTIVIFTGYQAMGTLGREIVEGKKSVYVEGLEVEVKARVEDITSMSAHADQEQLMKWLREIDGVKKVVLVHGEDSARKVLKDVIEKEFHYEVLMPGLKEEIEIL
jgi:metallo-beta-lactamase family protein